MWSDGSAVSCRYVSLDCMVLISGVLWGVPLICIPLTSSERLGISDLTCLGLGRSEEPHGRIQIHPIWWIWLCHGGVFLYLLCRTDLYSPMMQMTTPVLFQIHDGVHPRFFPWILHMWGMWTICTSCQTDWSQWIWRFLGCANAADRDNIQEVIYLGIGLMWNEAVVCGGRMGLDILVRYLFDKWKSTKS